MKALNKTLGKELEERKQQLAKKQAQLVTDVPEEPQEEIDDDSN